MAERDTPLFVPVQEELPLLYRRDHESWRQIGEFFAPFNQQLRGFLLALEELGTWLSPAAIRTIPPGLRERVGSPGAPKADRVADDAETEREIVRRRDEVLDELASWFDLEFGPKSLWSLPDDLDRARRVVEAKAHYLRVLPRLVRTRATPAGFLETFCLTFRLDPTSGEECPVLLEHFAFRSPDAPPATHPEPAPTIGIVCRGDGREPVDDGMAYRVTLLLAPQPQFETWEGWSEMLAWVERNAPAHLLVDVRMVSRGFWAELHETWLPDPDDLAGLLRAVASNVAAPDGWRTREDGADPVGGPRELGVARLAREDSTQGGAT